MASFRSKVFSDCTSSSAPQRRSAQPRGAEDEGESGGVSSNTPPSNPQTANHSAGILTSGGEDWLEISLYLEHQNFTKLSVMLDAAKEAAEAGDSPKDELQFNGQQFICRAMTSRAGSKEKRIAYRWSIDSEAGYTLLLMNRERPHATMPNAILRCTSLALMRHGTDACWAMALDALQAMGAEVCRNKVSRLDLCVDMGGVAVLPFYEAYQAGHYVTRARYSQEHLEESHFHGHRVQRKPTGFTIGRDNVSLRVYDKAIESRYDLEKLQLLIHRRWGEEVFQATRAEFQLRRQKLKDLGVDTLDDWYAKRAAIAEYLTHEWIYLTTDTVDSKHSERNQILPLWREVQQLFAQWCGEASGIALAPLPKQPINIENLIKQWVGLTLTILARLERPITGQEAFLHEAMYLLAEQVEDRDIAEEFRRRVLEQRVGR